jgi:hypothetical protein
MKRQNEADKTTLLKELACVFSGGTLLLLEADPTTVAMIAKAAREVCLNQ